MKVKISLNEKSVSGSIDELKKYKRWVAKKTKELTKKLAEIGMAEAKVLFSGVMYDGDNDVSVSIEQSAKGYTIIANGNAVAFIEFGAGVYYNTPDSYPIARPEGIVGIGEYGKGMGSRQMWGYYEGGELRLTRGNPAAMPLWYSLKEMEREVTRVAKEVFARD